MFEASGPRVFTLPPGVDFPRKLVAGLRARMIGKPPEAMAGVTLIVNTTRMQRRVLQILTETGAMILPRIRLITNLPILADLPEAAPALRRRLQLAQLISKLLDAQPDLAPRSALYDLADSLAGLMDEMHGEGVSPKTVADLDVSGHSAHWERSQEFLRLITPVFEDSEVLDVESRQRLAVGNLAEQWKIAPPANPVLIAGSTGSRGTTLQLMQLVASLPQGALILPGFDPDMPAEVWDSMSDAMTAEDHPQFRFRRLLDRLGLSPADTQEWHRADPPNPERNKLISLSLRPAPVTDRWLQEGPLLPDLTAATQEISLIEAQSQRQEATAIALILREAAETGTTAALITPDRTLTRQVTAVLDRWGILPDDSAGKPLSLSAPGRFLRHVADLTGEKLTSDRLLVLLKHPLTGSGAERGQHLLFTRDLELKLRREGPAFPDGNALRAWAAASGKPGALAWAEWLSNCICGLDEIRTAPLAEHVARHRMLSETLAAGPGRTGSGALWLKEAGTAALTLMDDLADEAVHGGLFTPFDYRALVLALLTRGEVRDSVHPHPKIMIWGTLEARVQGAELVILGGMNDGIWPRLPPPDPWLNRQMRKDAGLLLPERQIGLSAHDYQQAIAAPRVIITRSSRDAEAETVPSRWLNRLLNLMDGLPDQRGRDAVSQMRTRGRYWLDLARVLDAPTPEMRHDPRLKPAKRPQPRPPVTARPEKLSLTNIARLIRDPYAIYARYILRLSPLDPLRQAPDPRDRGNVFHKILERFVRERVVDETRDMAFHRLMKIATEVLAAETPFPAARVFWLARLERAAGHILTQDSKYGGTPQAIETQGALRLDPLPFTLFGTPDRIDRLPNGKLLIMDYKTGSPPSERQQSEYDKQLLLAAAMAERGGFKDLGPCEVEMISYIGLGAGEKAIETAITPELLADVWEKLIHLIEQYQTRETGYTARRAVFQDRFEGDYDHLARYGEWEMSDRATAEIVGPEALE